jgi:hypothetical protein
MSIYSYTDDPNRVASPGEAPMDYRQPVENDPSFFEDAQTECHAYDGSLIDDCASIVDLGYRLQALRDEPPAQNIFDVARERNEAAAEKARLLEIGMYSALKMSNALSGSKLSDAEIRELARAK